MNLSTELKEKLSNTNLEDLKSLREMVCKKLNFENNNSNINEKKIVKIFESWSNTYPEVAPLLEKYFNKIETKSNIYEKIFTKKYITTIIVIIGVGFFVYFFGNKVSSFLKNIFKKQTETQIIAETPKIIIEESSQTDLKVNQLLKDFFVEPLAIVPSNPNNDIYGHEFQGCISYDGTFLWLDTIKAKFFKITDDSDFLYFETISEPKKMIELDLRKNENANQHDVFFGEWIGDGLDSAAGASKTIRCIAQSKIVPFLKIKLIEDFNNIKDNTKSENDALDYKDIIQSINYLFTKKSVLITYDFTEYTSVNEFAQTYSHTNHDLNESNITKIELENNKIKSITINP